MRRRLRLHHGPPSSPGPPWASAPVITSDSGTSSESLSESSRAGAGAEPSDPPAAFSSVRGLSLLLSAAGDLVSPPFEVGGRVGEPDAVSSESQVEGRGAAGREAGRREGWLAWVIGPWWAERVEVYKGGRHRNSAALETPNRVR